MKYWVDITNLPHAGFFESFIKSYKCLVTARRFSYLEEMLGKKKIDFISVGAHGGRGRLDKLKASAERLAKLAGVLSRESIKASISKHSVEAPRAAFGLGIPSFHFVDNEFAEEQNRLTLALCTRIIVPKATSLERLYEQGAREEQLLRVNSILEIAQVKNFLPREQVVRELGLKDYVLLRPPPVEAAYYRGEDFTQEVIDELHREGYSVVVLPRGQESYSGALNLKNADSLNLAYFARATISGGGTMNREAAMLGKAAISFYPSTLLGVDSYLASHGLMRIASSPGEVVELVPDSEECEAIARRAARLRKKLEDPIEVLEKELEKLDDPYTEA